MRRTIEIKPAYPGQEIIIASDLDDSVFRRERLTRGVARFLRRVKPHSLSKKTISDIPELNHTPVSRPMRVLESLSAAFHFKREPIYEVADVLREAIDKGIPVYATTGRHASTIWDKGTRDQAERANLHFTDYILTPDGASTKVSKAKTIKRLGTTHYLEDDPDTIEYVNREIPGLQIIHIDHGHHLNKQYLAENPNITVMSAAELYRKRQEKKDKILGASETRNSKLRGIVATPIQDITRFVHKELPWLSPTHLNFLGAAEVILGSIIAASRDPNKLGGEKLKTGIAAGLIFLGSIKDAIDGALARLMAAEDPKSVNFKRGALYDVLSDRAQELTLSISRAWYAGKKGSTLGRISELAALATAITSPLPSISRAFSEYRGKPVPESGKGIFGLTGTRPGRAVLGGLTTVLPAPKGIPLQLEADILMTASNVITTADRLKTAFSNKEATLSKGVRKEAKARLVVLGIFTAVALAGSLFTYLRLNRKEEKPSEESLKDNHFVGVVTAIERYCQEQGLDHRFVGGTITDLIGPQTEFAIDIAKRTVTLKHPNTPTLVRPDGTIKDIDLVIFATDRDKFNLAKEYFKEWEAAVSGLPQVSVEAAYHPDWPARKKWKQFVTAFEINDQKTTSLVFGKVEQPVRPESIEPWVLDLGEGTRLTILNPVGHALCYGLRVPSGVKPKDKELIGEYANGDEFSKLTLISELAHQVRKAGLRDGIDYLNDTYSEWTNYIWRLHHESDTLTKTKAMITGFYWKTIGTQVAHGSGIFGRFSKYSNRLTG